MRGLKFKALSFAAVAVLIQSCALRASGRQGDAPDVQRFFLPGMKWVLSLDLHGFDTPLREMEADVKPAATNLGGAVAVAHAREFFGASKLIKGKPYGLGILSVRIEPARAQGDAKVLRAAALERLRKTEQVSVKQLEYKQYPLLKYTVDGLRLIKGMFPVYTDLSAFPIGTPSFPGRDGQLYVMEGYLVREGNWVTLRYATLALKGEDEERFRSLLDSATFAEAPTPSSSYDYYTLGRDLYQQREHGRAVAALEQALALEQKKRELTQPHWRDLVMTLANALGATDDTGRAREVLEYGASSEPTNPFFHYGLSRLYSYLGDLDRVLASLEQAYQYAPGARMPDPMSDVAFRRYKDDPRFRDAVKAWKKKYKN